SSSSRSRSGDKSSSIGSLLKADLYRYGIALFLLSGLINLLALTGSVYMLQVYDRVLTSGSQETLIALSVIAAALFLFHGTFESLRSNIFVKIGTRIDQRLAPLVHKVTLDMPRYGFSRAEAAEKGRALDTLRGFFASSAPGALFDLPWVPIFLGFVYLLHPVLGLVTLCGALVLTAMTIVAELRSRRLTRDTQSMMVKRNIISDSNTANSDTIAAMGLVDRALGRFVTANSEHLEMQNRSATINAAISSYSKMLRMLLQSSLLGIGAYYTIQGQMSAGAIIAVSVASSRALAPIDQIIGNWRNILSARYANKQLKDTVKAAQDVEENMDLPVPSRTLCVENMTVASPASGRVLLSDVSFELQAGQALAIIGPSGGGKSTLMRALSGVWSPIRGSVRLDGMNLQHYSPENRSRMLGYLPQDVTLFEGTIFDNITRFGSMSERSDAFATAEEVGIHKLIASFPEGYNTYVGPHSTVLSAGQRQRVGLARALYQRPFLVLLDEPNSSLDALGERALNETITQIKARGGIAIVVAHRPSVLEAVDTVAVVHKGRLVSFGPKEKVMPGRGGQMYATVAGEGLDAGAAA
ncbi:type I secretion system permease/ATPase, partial [Pararhodobacter sp. CCB-MM2]|uniref:type I secretion system permease/ATPase n=1 Tax=Pararhodobacter sp. CCB-MM2 TaxID=1786003 RepID=UPI0009F16140